MFVHFNLTNAYDLFDLTQAGLDFRNLRIVLIVGQQTNAQVPFFQMLTKNIKRMSLNLV